MKRAILCQNLDTFITRQLTVTYCFLLASLLRLRGEYIRARVGSLFRSHEFFFCKVSEKCINIDLCGSSFFYTFSRGND